MCSSLISTFELRVVALCQVAISQKDHCVRSCNQLQRKTFHRNCGKNCYINHPQLQYKSQNGTLEKNWKKVLEKYRKTLRDIPWSITGRNILRAVPEEPLQKSRENHTEVCPEETREEIPGVTPVEIRDETTEERSRNFLKKLLNNLWKKSLDELLQNILKNTQRNCWRSFSRNRRNTCNTFRVILGKKIQT